MSGFWNVSGGAAVRLKGECSLQLSIFHFNRSAFFQRTCQLADDISVYETRESKSSTSPTRTRISLNPAHNPPSADTVVSELTWCPITPRHHGRVVHGISITLTPGVDIYHRYSRGSHREWVYLVEAVSLISLAFDESLTFLLFVPDRQVVSAGIHLIDRPSNWVKRSKRRLLPLRV
jgi:hypothetical protein